MNEPRYASLQRCEDRLEDMFGHLGSVRMLEELDLALTHSTLTPIMREAITRKRDSIQDQLMLWGRFVRTTDRALGINR